jgi:hypothetical protein
VVKAGLHYDLSYVLLSRLTYKNEATDATMAMQVTSRNDEVEVEAALQYDSMIYHM